MRIRTILLGLASYLVATTSLASPDCHPLIDFEATKLRSSDKIDFCERFAGKALLVVNTASQCGYTKQFEGLEKLHQAYRGRLALIGFPSNDFKQEYADSEKVANVCYQNYGVSFTMLEPSSVKGDRANSLFKALAQRTGVEPTWNFNKYLVSTDGSVVKHFPSNIEPMGEALLLEIEKVLSK